MVLAAFATVFTLYNLLLIAIGTLVGLFVGALPGLGAAIGVALMLPFTYSMDTLPAILILVALYLGSEYGGSISSITLGIPGTPAAVATVLDGHPMAKKGFPAKAIGYSLFASTIGGLFGGAVLIGFSGPLANAAVKLGAPEYAFIGLLGLVAVATLSTKDVFRSVISVFLGLLLSAVGMDALTGQTRFVFGRMELVEGLPMVPILIGLFAVSEVIQMISDGVNKRYEGQTLGLNSGLTLKEIKTVSKPMLLGSLIGSVVGVIPGLGAGPASWFSYSLAKRFSKDPDSFGKGNPEGIAAPESSNNATVGGALVPLLALGIPGSPTTGIILGAFVIHGIQPGPQVFAQNPELVYGLFIGFIVSVLAMYVFGRLTTPIWARALAVPNYILIISILVLSLLGAFTSRMLVFDVYIAVAMGIVGFFMRKLDYSLPCFILAFILGGFIEINFRRSLIMSNVGYGIFVNRPVSAILLGLMAIMIFFMVKGMINDKKKKAKVVG
ncbi:tripartite tricarboxylate transporter permease [Desulfosporosinus burensis]